MIKYPCDTGKIFGFSTETNVQRGFVKFHRNDFTKKLAENNFDVANTIPYLIDGIICTYMGSTCIDTHVYRLPSFQEILLLLWEFSEFIEYVRMPSNSEYIFVKFKSA